MQSTALGNYDRRRKSKYAAKMPTQGTLLQPQSQGLVELPNDGGCDVTVIESDVDTDITDIESDNQSDEDERWAYEEDNPDKNEYGPRDGQHETIEGRIELNNVLLQEPRRAA
jgi:hypothetical protein